ncbi:MAG TPA: TetR-like C-terminal domain-containing protein [Euzebyales bacterium]|nr:TetR-like C-terminal domain-containing protein [Euzebyales bacterium]
MTTTGSYHHGDLRAALLREAGSLLESSGAEAISLRGLARALDVSHAAPSHHFPNRIALLAELAADGYAQLAEDLAAAMATTAPDRWLAATGRAYVRFALANPERYRLMFTSRLTQGDCPDRLEDEASRAYRLLLQAVQQREADVDPASYRMAAAELRAWSLVHGAVMLWLDGQLGDVSEVEFVALIDLVVADAG